MSLGSSRGWRYRFSCLGATLLLGALALTSSARAQAPALPYDQADIQLKVQKSANLQRQAGYVTEHASDHGAPEASLGIGAFQRRPTNDRNPERVDTVTEQAEERR